jgi:hypothetical protein
MKASCIQNVRIALGIIKETFPMIHKGKNVGVEDVYKNISASFACLPGNSINILKEELLH